MPDSTTNNGAFAHATFYLSPEDFARLGERLTELMIEAFEAER